MNLFKRGLVASAGTPAPKPMTVEDAIREHEGAVTGNGNIFTGERAVAVLVKALAEKLL